MCTVKVRPERTNCKIYVQKLLFNYLYYGFVLIFKTTGGRFLETCLLLLAESYSMYEVRTNCRVSFPFPILFLFAHLIVFGTNCCHSFGYCLRKREKVFLWYCFPMLIEPISIGKISRSMFMVI